MLLNAALLSLALPAVYGAVHEKVNLPLGWAASDAKVSDEQAMHLSVALNYKNLDSLESRLMEVSHPDSAKYGKWLEKDDVDAIFHPDAKDVQRVKDWVSKAGATDVEYLEGIVSFKTTVGNANRMLSTKFAVYSDGKQHKLRTTQYSVPDELKDVVDLVSPTTYFGTVRANAAIPVTEGEIYDKLEERAVPGKVKKSCFKKVKFNTTEGIKTFPLVTPECLKQFYSVGDYTPDAKSGSSIAFGNFLNQSASFSDLYEFEKLFDIPHKSYDVLALINGGKNNQNPKTESDGEANLDVQNIIGLVGDLPVGAYITGGSPPYRPDALTPLESPPNQNEPYLPYYQYLNSQSNSNLPLVITNSYGDDENTVPPNYAKRVCNMIGMLSMRGRTIFESSGDTGTGAPCRANTGKKQPQFTPTFPATCPYLTSVGGTQSDNPEVAWDASSGGFSFYFSQPSYQTAAVSSYLSDYINPVAKQYYASNEYVNFAGRGFPDLSAHSLTPYYLTIINGSIAGNGGTSAASPATAAIFALLNDALLRAGKSQLGFINPMLYTKLQPAINDITAGSATGCNGVDAQNGIKIPNGGIIPYASWNATKGWDPVTGLGTPNFAALKNVLVG